MSGKKRLESLKQCLFLLPGYELDSYPRYLESDQAAALLSGWASLWHPLILNAMQSIPAWQQAASAPSELAGSLILVPEIAKPELDNAFQESQSSVLLEPKAPWRDFQNELLDILELSEASHPLVAELKTDFAALGYAYLQIQLMTRQLRYTSNLDQLLFADQVVSAAEAAMAGEAEKAEEGLQACFDTLGQERDHYYSLDVHLLDVTLLAPTVLGKSLTVQLDSSSVPTSFLGSASLLTQLHQEHPENFSRLQAALENGEACIVGGLQHERPHPLMTRESFTRDLLRGQQAYQDLGLDAPKIFGRFGFGMTTDQATDLKRFGFSGVFLVAWSEGSYPEGSQAKISWESSDGTFISTIATEIRDASDASSFLSLGWDVGDALDHQHVPTLVFAHWPGKQSAFYEWLQIISKRTPALGRWIKADTYFEETDDPYHQERLNVRDFKLNWLAKAEDPHQLILAVKYFQSLSSRCRSLQNLANLAWQLENYRPSSSSNPTPSTEPEANDEKESEASPNTEERSEEEDSATPLSAVQTTHTLYSPQMLELMELVDSILDSPSGAHDAYRHGLQLADACAEDCLKKLRSQLSPAKESQEAPTGRLLVNPRSFPQRIRVQSESDRGFAPESWRFASGRVGHDRYTCIDLPSFGFVVAPFENPIDESKQQHLAEIGGVLQNEFFEAQIDTHHGHLRSLYMPGKRGNRLSVMVARRDRLPSGKLAYSEMQAKDVRMLTSSNMCGLVRATGKLVDNDQTMADFEIDYETWRGSRILEIVVRLKNVQALADQNPWRSAYVLRIAWATEAAILRTFPCGRRHPWPSGQAISPTLVEIDEAEYCTHVLTGGLTFHRRTDTRFMETILPIDFQTNASESRIGIGIDLPYPQQLAQDFIDRRYSIPIHAPNLKPSHGWLINSGAKNVSVHLEAPLVNDEQETVGARLFVRECSGKSTTSKIRLMHNVARANRVNTQGKDLGKLTTDEDCVTIALRANEQSHVDVLWA